jgi:DNA-directed RNA polymerase specialized sigma24 family protein
VQDNETLRALVARCRRGDGSAARELREAMEPAISTLHRNAKRFSLVEVQSAFWRAVGGISLEHENTRKALRGQMRRELFREHRADKEAKKRADHVGRQLAALTPEELGSERAGRPTVSKEEMAGIFKLYLTCGILTEEEYFFLYGRHVVGHPYRHIAPWYGLSVDAVKQRHSRLKDKLLRVVAGSLLVEGENEF